MANKEKVIEYFKAKNGKLYILEERTDGLSVIKLNGRVSSIHSSLELGKQRMQQYRKENSIINPELV